MFTALKGSQFEFLFDGARGFPQAAEGLPPAVRGLPSAVLLYGVLCTGGGLPPASAGDTLPPAAWLVPEGASSPGFLCCLI